MKETASKNLTKIFMFLKENGADMNTFNSFFELEKYLNNLDKISTRIIEKLEESEKQIDNLLITLNDNKSKDK